MGYFDYFDYLARCRSTVVSESNAAATGPTELIALKPTSHAACANEPSLAKLADADAGVDGAAASRKEHVALGHDGGTAAEPATPASVAREDMNPNPAVAVSLCRCRQAICLRCNLTPDQIIRHAMS